jgi:hypothetical protein
MACGCHLTGEGAGSDEKSYNRMVTKGKRALAVHVSHYGYKRQTRFGCPRFSFMVIANLFDDGGTHVSRL